MTTIEKLISVLKEKNLGIRVYFSANKEIIDAHIKAEQEEYREMRELLKRAYDLVGHPCTNISSSTDIACDNWRADYAYWLANTLTPVDDSSTDAP